MKKLLPILLALVLILSAAPIASAEESPTFEFVTRYIATGDGNMNYNEGNPVTKYLEDLTGVHINFTMLPATDDMTKLNTMIAGGELPDALFDVMNVTQPMILEWAEEGVIEPMEDLIAEYMPNLSAILAERPDIATAVTAPDGHIYCFPRTDGGIHMLVNNKIYVYGPWYEAYLTAGNPEVVTTEDYANMLRYFRDNDMNGNGNAADELPVSGGKSLIQNLINPFTLYGSIGGLYLEDGVVSCPYLNEEYREGLRYIHGLWEEGLIDVELFTQDDSQVNALVNREAETERVVGGFSSLWDGSYVNAAIIPYDTYIAIGPLVGPEGVQQATYSYNDVRAASAVIFADCENKAELCRWLDYLYSYEGTILMAYGLEGVSWNWVDTPSIAGEARSIERTASVSELYAQNLQWDPNAPCYRTPEIKYVESAVPGGSGIDLYNSSMLYMPYADSSKAINPLLWQTSEMTEDRALYEESILTFIAEWEAAFVTGAKDLDADWEEYVGTLEAMGIEDYLALMQEIVDYNA